MDFYRGKAFAGWNSSVFNGDLALKHINRLVIEEGRVFPRRPPKKKDKDET